MLLTWILPVSLLAGLMGSSHIQSEKALHKANLVSQTAKFVPDPTPPPVITQGSGTR